MSVSVSTKAAVRNLFRHPRRSILSAVGVGVGCMLAMVMTGIMQGQGDMFVTAAAEGGAGHLKIVPAGWPEARENALRLADWRAELETVRSLEGVRVATPRARVEATLGMGSRIAGVEMVGVDPETEQEALRTVRNVVSGRYLEPGDDGALVVGKAVAERLDVEVGDEIVATVVDKSGEMQAAMLTLVGITETGSEEIDSAICHANLPDVEKLWGSEEGGGGAGEIAILLEDMTRLDEAARGIRQALSGKNALLKWSEVSPELKSVYKMKVGYGSTMTGVLLIVVFLGIASAQLAAVLERRREFAVLSALGMKARQMAALVVYEALVLGVAGAVIGLLLGSPIVYYMATSGLDLRGIIGDEAMESGGVLIDMVLYAHLGPWMMTQTLFIALTATLLASIYPAWYAVRTDPAEALRVAG